MNDQQVTYNQMERTAMGLTLLIHLILAISIVITFPVRSVGNNPALVFLGSILDLKEFTDLTSTSEIPEPVKIDVSVPILKSPVRINVEPVNKPAYTPFLGHSAKEHLKETFLEEPQPRQHDDASLKRLGIKTEVPPRIPLRLESYGGRP